MVAMTQQILIEIVIFIINYNSIEDKLTNHPLHVTGGEGKRRYYEEKEDKQVAHQAWS